MPDFAQLRLVADTTGLKQGITALDDVVKAGGRAETATTKTGHSFEKAGRDAQASTAKVEGFSRGLKSVAGIAAGMAGALAAAFSVRAIISGISEFETSMSKVQAISGATGATLTELRDIAKDLGSTTEFSAAQAADGLSFLAMAGFSAQESLSAIPAVLDLATASGMGLAAAADTASNIMSGFGIAASDAASVADVLAAASSRANTDVAQLGSAMSTVAPIAATLGISLEDTASAIGVMSDAGIQGERAGTALRGVLASLAGPTKAAEDALAKYHLKAKDVNPELHSLADIMTTLRERGLSTADAMTIFGREAASGALVLAGSSDRLSEFGDELRSASGAAADMAGTMRDNLGGDIKGLQSAISGLIIAMGDAGLTAALRAATQAMTEVFRFVSENLIPIFQSFGLAIATITATALPALIARMAATTAAMLSGASAAGVMAAAVRGLNIALSLAGGPLGLVAGLLTAAAGAAIIFGRDMGTAEGAMSDAQEAASVLGTELAILAGNDLPATSKATIQLANDNLSLAKSALAAAEAQMKLRQANLQAGFNQMAMENADLPGWVNPGQAIYEQQMRDAVQAATEFRKAEEELNKRIFEGNQIKRSAAEELENITVTIEGTRVATEGLGGAAKKTAKDVDDMRKRVADLNKEAARGLTPLERYGTSLAELEAMKALGLTDNAYSLELEKMNEELAGSLPMVNDVANAFGDFISRGFKDFQGFTKSILNSFKSMLSQMIATAARNRIMLSIAGSASGVAGTAANAAGGAGGAVGIAGTIGSLGTLASGIGTGLSGVMGGGSIAAGVSGGFAAGGAAGIGTAIGADLPILAPLAIAGFLVGRRRRRRERRRAAAEAQRQAEEQAAAAEAARQQAIGQQRFGLESRLLELQGDTNALREREIATLDVSNQALARQIFALEDMNRIMDERFGIENRLLELQGRSGEVLARNRQKEIEATDESNRALLWHVFALEDQAAAAAEAARMQDAAIQRTMDLFRNPLRLDSNRFDDRYTATMQAAEDRRFQVQKASDEAQLTELKLMRLALEELRRETRDAALYGVNA